MSRTFFWLVTSTTQARMFAPFSPLIAPIR